MPLNLLKKTNPKRSYSSNLVSLSSQKISRPTKKKPLESSLNIKRRSLNTELDRKDRQIFSKQNYNTRGKSYKNSFKYSKNFNTNRKIYPNKTLRHHIDKFFAYEKLNALNTAYFLSLALFVTLALIFFINFSQIITNFVRHLNHIAQHDDMIFIKNDYKSLFRSFHDSNLGNDFFYINDNTKSQKWRDPMINDFNYKIKKGENIYYIAKKFSYLSTRTLINYNSLKNAGAVFENQIIKIPNQNGILYKVRSNDSISTIATKYGILENAVYDVNNLKSNVIKVGQVLFLPGVKMSDKEFENAIKKPSAVEHFIIPIIGRFRITSRFGKRRNPFTNEEGDFHHGIDLAAPVGTRVVASKSGVVNYAGYDPRIYGYFVQINHGDGMYTVYGHLSKIFVKKGQKIKQGHVLGLVGATGQATGPHLHFEFRKLRHFGGYDRINPELYVPALKK